MSALIDIPHGNTGLPNFPDDFEQNILHELEDIETAEHHYQLSLSYLRSGKNTKALEHLIRAKELAQIHRNILRADDIRYAIDNMFPSEESPGTVLIDFENGLPITDIDFPEDFESAVFEELKTTETAEHHYQLSIFYFVRDKGYTRAEEHLAKARAIAEKHRNSSRLHDIKRLELTLVWSRYLQLLVHVEQSMWETFLIKIPDREDPDNPIFDIEIPTSDWDSMSLDQRALDLIYRLEIVFYGISVSALFGYSKQSVWDKVTWEETEEKIIDLLHGETNEHVKKSLRKILTRLRVFRRFEEDYFSSIQQKTKD